MVRQEVMHAGDILENTLGATMLHSQIMYPLAKKGLLSAHTVDLMEFRAAASSNDTVFAEHTEGNISKEIHSRTFES